MVDQNSQFYAILTKVGAAKQANADALGIPWKITHMAVGDASPAGLDNPPLPMPDASWTSLLNEWRRAPLNQLKVDEKDSAVIVAEQVIPAEIGGRWIREVGLYDADGDLVAVANCAPTYKPLLNQGSGRTQVVRMNLVVSSASNVQLKIDPGVVLATREFVTEELTKRDFKHSVLAATTAAITLSGLQTMDGVALQAGARVLVKNQVAAKDNGLYLVASGAWTRCPDADSSVKVTPGLLVLVERGTANGDSAWQLTTDAPITLGVTALAFEMAFGRSGVAAGTYRSVKVDAYGRVVAATNPTTLSGYGITDSYTKAQIEEMIAEASAIPVGAILALPVNNIPPGWLEVDNSAKSIAAYPDLAAFLGGAYNNGTEPAGYFRLPESRGTVLRGWDHGRGVDAARQLSTEQLDAVQSIAGKLTFRGFAPGSSGSVYTADGPFTLNIAGGTNSPYTTSLLSGAVPQDTVAFDISKVARVAAETRMRNVSVIWCIKAWSAPINQGNIDIAALAALAAQATETNLGMVRIATQAQVNAGLADDVLVTPKKLRWGLTASFTTNGYLVFPSWLGGFTVQWGALSGNAGVRDLNFPLEFPSSVLQLMLTGQASQATVGEYNDQWVNSLSKSGAVIYAEAAQSIRWLALGR
ncbi:phage tail protein [Pseudomonas qingdaonensis]|uniref:phage tail-collar fiber domain-containing protein n=1 Tax=Pseudomonas qingdaonensis TaxID=2056231 RepID=UPI002E192CA5|nr:phage tail protein [Pseudomonas qingdaonensis]